MGEAVAAAFALEGLPDDLGRVTPSNRPDLADFQSNAALAAAKPLKRDPTEIAAAVARSLHRHPAVDSAEAAGPGFLNLRVSNALLSARANALADDPRAGAEPVAAPARVLVDYGGPNVAKEMIVSHLRASIIGESIKRLHRFAGDRTLGDAHLGDWGFQMGLLIVAVLDERIELVDALAMTGDADSKPTAAQQAAIELVSLEDLDRLYPIAAARAKADPLYRERARRATAELQAGRGDYQLLWRQFVRITKQTLERDFHALGVDFDLWKGESDVEPLIEPMIADLEAKGLLVEDQGARIIRVARPEDRRELPPLLIVSSEGAAMYGTTDLATIVDRRRYFDPQRILYVVDQRQADHFETVFRAAYLAAYAPEGSLEHIGFGTMNGPDGKPFRTREGGVLKLRDLIDMALTKARERLEEAGLGKELSPELLDDTALKVAVATLKFADLASYRGTSYVFDLDRFSSFEGKTGPYLLYQAVRVKSLLRKATAEGLEAGEVTVAAPAERDLVLVLDAFGQGVNEAYARSAPNVIADHAWRLAQSFSKFYQACPILTANPAIAASRLALASLTLKQLELALDLLGISAPERM